MKAGAKLSRFLCLSGLLLAGACHGTRKPEEPSHAAPVEVKVVTVRPKPVPLQDEVPGTVRGRSRAEIAPKLLGYVAEVRVRAGDAVERDQPLVMLAAAEVEAQRERAEAGHGQAVRALAEAESALAAATAQAELQEATFARIQELAGRRAVTQQEVDEAEARVRAARAQRELSQASVERARFAVAQAAAEVQAARARRADATLTAPFAGTVVERHVEPGQLAQPGRPLLVLEETSALRVEAKLGESQAGRVHVGDSVEVELDSGKTVEAVVAEVESAVDPGSRAFRIRVDLPPSAVGPGVAPGGFARVRIPIGMSERLTVPESAVVRRGQLDLLFVLDEGRAQLRIVTLGDSFGRRLEVLSGLQDGEQVITAPLDRLEDGAPAVASP